jgi:hypothetical protein
MYSASTLKTELIGLIGWRQNRDSNGLQLQGLTSTSSGLYYNDVHPLLTFDNLLSIGPDLDLIDSDPADQAQAFTDWLQEKTEAGIIKAVTHWLDYKLPRRTAKNLLERRQLWQTAAGSVHPDTSNGRLVGIELVPKRSRDLQLTIEEIGLQFTENQSITIQLFSSDQQAAVQSTTVSYTGAGSVQWEQVNWTVEGYGAHYIVYHQDDISGQSINGAYDYFERSAISQQIPGANMVLASPFEVDASTASLWDISRMGYKGDTNYGLNLRLNVQCDYTNLIVGQKELFKTLISLHVAAVLLGEMAYNPNARLNRNQTLVSTEQVLFELHGDSQGPRPMGLLHQIEKAAKSISLDMQQLDKHCLPCRRRGVRYTTV